MSPRKWLAWLFRDRRDDDPNRPDWQALVDAVDLAAHIAHPWGDRPIEHVIRTSVSAQAIADYYYGSAVQEAVDGELFALEAALAMYPDDLFGRGDAVRRFEYLRAVR